MHTTKQKTIQFIIVLVLSLALVTIIAAYVYIGMRNAGNTEQFDSMSPDESTNETTADKEKFKAELLHSLENATSTAPDAKVKSIIDSLESSTDKPDEATTQAILDRL